MKRGKKPNIERIQLAQRLRAEGKSYRQIARILNCDVKSAWRFVKYIVG